MIIIILGNVASTYSIQITNFFFKIFQYILLNSLTAIKKNCRNEWYWRNETASIFSVHFQQLTTLMRAGTPLYNIPVSTDFIRTLFKQTLKLIFSFRINTNQSYTFSYACRVSHTSECAGCELQNTLLIVYVFNCTSMNFVSLTLQFQMLTVEVNSCGIFISLK